MALKPWLVAVLVLLPTYFPRQYDEAGARRAVQAYLDGMSHGDTTALFRAFDRDGFLDFVKPDATLGRLPVPEWAAGWAGKSLDPAQYPPGRIKLDLHDNAGYARVELNWPKTRYVDYLALLRVGNEWKIVSKIWHQEAPGAQALPSDEAGIKTAVQAYFDAVTNNDRAATMRAFHPESFIMTARADRLSRAPFQQWANFSSEAKSPEAAQRRSKIISIDQTGERAVAKVDLEWPEVHYVDYLSLMKFGSEWRIINKVWFSEPSKQSLAGVKDVSLTPAQLQPYLGKYQLEGRTFEIVVSGGHLAIQLGGDKFDLVAQGNHEFAVAMSPRDRIVFTMLNGKATQMEMRQFGRPPIAIKRTE